MDVFAAVSMLVRSAQSGSFSAAARDLGLTPAAVSKQVARLEREVGAQLVVRTTRSLSLTDDGQRLVDRAAPALQTLQAALNTSAPRERGLTGVLRVSLAPAFGRGFVLPALGPLLDAHPGLKLDWQFDNRQVDLVADGFDAGIAGGVDLAGGLVARTLAPLHLVPVAAPRYLAESVLPEPRKPSDLEAHPAIVLRSPSTRRVRPWKLQRRGQTAQVTPQPRLWLSDPEAVVAAAQAGYGVALAAMTHVQPLLASGTLVRLLLPWWSDAGSISVYFPRSDLMPAKTRAFVDHLVAVFADPALQRRLCATA